MNAHQYFREQGFSPVHVLKGVSNVGNVVVWQPTTSLRIALTNLTISSNLGGTIQFFFGGKNNVQKLAEFTVAGSATIVPIISDWESTAIDAPLYVNTSQSGTNGWNIEADLFELE